MKKISINYCFLITTLFNEWFIFFLLKKEFNDPMIPRIGGITGSHIEDSIISIYRVIDKDGIIQQCNDEYVKHFAQSEKEIIGKTIFQNLHSSQQDIEHTSFENWKNSGRITRRVLNLKTKNEEYHKFFVTGRNIRDEGNNKIIARQDVLREFAQIEITREKLRNFQYQNLYKNSPDMYRTVNSTGVIVDCNKAYYEKLGYEYDEVIGDHFLDHTATDSQEIMTDNMVNWRKNGTIKTEEIRMLKKDGSTFPAMLTPSTIYDDDGKLFGRNIIIKDINELNELKQELTSRDELDAIKEELLFMVTHELRSPLSPLTHWCQILQNPEMVGELSKVQKHAVEMMGKNLKRLSLHINELFDAMRLDQQINFPTQKFDVKKMMDEFYKNWVGEINDKKIKFVNSTSEEIILESSENKIEQVLTSLLINAIDFTNPRNGLIEIGAREIDDNILFFVKDNGIGIPEDMKKKIFEKFVKFDDDTYRELGGTGLGLFVANGIIKNLNGRIWVDSKLGTETIFQFTLPKKFKGQKMENVNL